jgi:NADP-dependent 3-hydroxy acid dehydrogenase YdfG
MVTGAGGGIGQAVALALGADGWDVALAGRSRDALVATRDQLTGRAAVLAADVRDPRQVADAVTTGRPELADALDRLWPGYQSVLAGLIRIPSLLERSR